MFLPHLKSPFPGRSQDEDIALESRMESQKLAEDSHLLSPNTETSLPGIPGSCTALFPVLGSP